MYQKDTCDLLKECNTGIKMAVDAIDDVLPNVQSTKLKDTLTACKKEHESFGNETHELLLKNHQKDEEPSMMAKGMSWMKTNLKMSVNPGDDTIANLISTGCDMGVRTLYKTLNDCTNASQEAKSLVKKVIASEEALSADMRAYL
ncbi:MAG: hypothetical protein Q4D60_08810 [Eubacteriales bacterium]|nr:hypothetical protein [Eubacteriales bacterium]